MERALDTVGEAEDGKQACELAQQLQPDVILMDFHMQKMNGLEATRWIKARFPNVVIIGLSVNTSAAAAHEMKVAGASTYVSKDIEPGGLYRAILAAFTHTEADSLSPS